MGKGKAKKNKSVEAPPDDEMVRFSTGPVEFVKVGDIQEHPSNPRRGDVDLIEQSIGKHGMYGACIVQRSTGFILIGNHTYRACRQRGAAVVPVQFIDVDDTEALAIMIGDNQISDLADTDAESLRQIFDQLNADDLEATGFEMDAAGDVYGLPPAGDRAKADCRYPITPMMGEKYSYVIIFTTSEADYTWLRNALGVVAEKSYKNSRVQPGQVVPFGKFYEAWQRRDGGDHSLA